MNKEIVKIYEDDTQQVYMFKEIADTLWKIKLTNYRLKPKESDTVMNAIFEDAFNGEKVKNTITYTSTIPILTKELNGIILSEPYHIFEEAILLINDAICTANFPLNGKWKKEVSMLIKYYYKLQGLGRCKCGFFNKPLYNVDGYLCYYNDDNLKRGPIILPFIIDDGKIKRLY